MTLPRFEYFIHLERQVWEALVAGDAAADTALLDDDFVGVYPTGFAGRAEHVGQLADGPTVAAYSINRPVLITISDDAALLAYEARFRRTLDAELETMYVSSLWCRRDGRWVNTFSQDTPRGGPVP
ncbi:MAG TPA: nuclear transport factor 2 family protein [Ilumatobacter sp.]|nr:nuclear transport factor 2 family protein [Ilumatobacter sp.]